MCGWFSQQRLRSAVVVVLAVLTTAPNLASAADNPPTDVRKGPNGLAFYTPPSSLKNSTHGQVLWARKLTGDAALSNAADNYLVLYSSVTASGKKVAVSGTVAIPKGEPPRKGWPLISWAHGTTGVADACAPSRDNPSSPVHEDLINSTELLNRWVKKGYAVARTDYQGLGTSGPHSYLIGVPEARAVIDIARATHKLNLDISRKWVAMGHSQGGHATLFSARYAERWAPELSLVGAVALAPASHVATEARLLPTLTGPLPFAGLVPLVIVGAQTAGFSQVDQLLTSQAIAKLPLTEKLCAEALDGPEGWGSLLVQDTFLPTNPSYSSLFNILEANDPSKLKIRVPLLILQGTADKTVFQTFTDELVQSLKTDGASLTYGLFQGQTHGSIPDASYPTASRWVKQRFK